MTVVEMIAILIGSCVILGAVYTAVRVRYEERRIRKLQEKIIAATLQNMNNLLR